MITVLGLFRVVDIRIFRYYLRMIRIRCEHAKKTFIRTGLGQKFYREERLLGISHEQPLVINRLPEIIHLGQNIFGFRVIQGKYRQSGEVQKQ